MKMSFLVFRLVVLFLLLNASFAWGQNTVFTYQGRIVSNGSNFTGAGQFKFALVTSTNFNLQATATAVVNSGFVTSYSMTANGSGYSSPPAVTIFGGGGSGAIATANVSGGMVTSLTANNPGSGFTSTPTVTIAPPPANILYTTYWSNDGTSSAGSEPAAAVNIAVSNGLFAVVLGDTTIANMSAINASLFAQPNLQLRIWFNDGVNGFAALSPVQNLTPTPYAVTALNASNLLGTLPVSQLSGTIPAAQLPVSVVTNGANISGSFTGNGAGITNLNFSVSSAGAISLSGGFTLASSPSVGFGPESLTVADVNGDSKADLITANFNASTLTVLTNNGSGAFAIASSPGIGNGPRSVITADVNADGKADLISANYAAGTLSVLTNNGSGSFVIASSPSVGSSPYSVKSADVNGDGRADLISANFNGNTLSVLTNNGSGGFVTASSPAVGTNPVSVTSADVNADSKMDLICANYGAGTLSVLTNNGSGSFVIASSPPVGTSPISVIAADVNGDGKADIISASQNGNTLSVLTNIGTGGFVLSSTLSVGLQPFSVISTDLNGDGAVDLITANQSGDTLSVLFNRGGGSFVLSSSPRVGDTPLSVVAADVNGDGKTDLISANNSGSTLSVLFNTLTVNGTFTGDSYGFFSGDGSRLVNAAGWIRNGGSIGYLDGNVGIGTTNPVQRLHLVGADGRLRLQALSGSAATEHQTDTRTWHAGAGGSANGPSISGKYFVTDATANLTRMVVDSSGNVGIGTTTPGATLEVVTANSSGNAIRFGFSGGGQGNLIAGPSRVAIATGDLVERISIPQSTGNVGLGTTTPSQKLHVIGNILASGTITPNSDVNAKTDFGPVNVADVLDSVVKLPIQQWRFKTEPEQVKHVGPMAQDFRSAFGLGEVPTAIATVDADGVALAAIQGLNEKVETQNQKLAAENADLKARLEKLEKRLEHRLRGGVQ